MHVLSVVVLNPGVGLFISIACNVIVSRMVVSGFIDFIVTLMGPIPFSAQSISAPDSFMSKKTLSLSVTPPGDVNSTMFRGSAFAFGIWFNVTSEDTKIMTPKAIILSYDDVLIM